MSYRTTQTLLKKADYPHGRPALENILILRDYDNP